MSSASEDQNIPQEPELDLYQREERCSRAIKNIARACVTRLVVTGLLLYVLLRQQWELWLWGLLGFVMDTIGGVLCAKIMNLFLPQGKKINPMIGGAGISAFPMSARVIQKMALKEDNQNHLLMHAIGANVSGQIGSVLAGGILLNLIPVLIGG